MSVADYEYLCTSVLRFPAPDKFIKMLKSEGFKRVEHKPLNTLILNLSN